jgi:hypothetical protein
MEKLTVKDSSTTVTGVLEKNDYVYNVTYNHSEGMLKSLQCDIMKKNESGQQTFAGFMSVRDNNKNVTVQGISEPIAPHVSVLEEILQEIETELAAGGVNGE